MRAEEDVSRVLKSGVEWRETDVKSLMGEEGDSASVSASLLDSPTTGVVWIVEMGGRRGETGVPTREM